MTLTVTRRALLVIATSAAMMGLAHADQLDDIRKKGELVVGVLGTDEPNSFVDPKTREIVGYEVDLAKAVAQKLGVKLKLKQLAVAARIPELQQGHVDLLAASLTHNKEREAVIDFSLTTFVTGQKVLVKKDSGIQSLGQLAGKKVVTVKGGTQEPNVRRAVPSVEVVTFDTGPQAFQALQQGKGVAFVNDEVSLLDQHAKLGAGKSLIATNGAQTGLDIARMMLAGASAVEMSSPVMIRGTSILADALAEFEAYLKRKNLNAADLIGVAADRRSSFPARPLRTDDWKQYVAT